MLNQRCLLVLQCVDSHQNLEPRVSVFKEKLPDVQKEKRSVADVSHLDHLPAIIHEPQTYSLITWQVIARAEQIWRGDAELATLKDRTELVSGDFFKSGHSRASHL